MEEQLVVDFFTEENQHWWHKAKRELILGQIDGRNRKILVAGVGGGMLCRELKLNGHDVTGVDISQVACEHVNQTMGISVFCADLEKPLMFPAESFDFVIVADVLEHLNNEVQLLREIFCCLKPKGSVIITVPAYAHMWSTWDERLNHKRRYTASALHQQLVDAGYVVKKLSYFHMLLYPLVYVYRKVFRSCCAKHSEKSDFAVLPRPAVTAFFGGYYAFERWLLRFMNLPFGLSVFTLGEKDG